MEDTEQIEEEVLEPTLDVETAPDMEPSHVLACRLPSMLVHPHQYWQAQNLASNLHRQFEELQARGDRQGMRRLFYLLARYYGRTLAILRQALKSGNERLVNTALRNLIALHQPLHHMHDIAPTSVPLALTLAAKFRLKLIDDMVVKTLEQANEPADLKSILHHVNEVNLTGKLTIEQLTEHIAGLVGAGFLKQTGPVEYMRSRQRYTSVNVDRAGLEALLGDELYLEFLEAGFQGVSSLINRRREFRRFFQSFTTCSQHMADLFIAACVELLGPPGHEAELSPWAFTNLIHSQHPRPYQYEAFSVFRGYGYQGQIVEAPTGSGKTMIGMMCIQDWLRTMSPGETILVAVPTVNYQQQWVEELSLKTIGLNMMADDVFAGTPGELHKRQKRTSSLPPVVVLTYASLSSLGNRTEIIRFLQETNIQYVILDEAHKLAEDLKSASARAASLMAQEVSRGRLRGLIGFSGTASAFRDRFHKLGLELVYSLPAADITAYGFVAPFTEMGVPFAYSDREKNVRKLISDYKKQLQEYLELLGTEKLKACLADIPPSKRLTICRDWLEMYAGYKDRDAAINRRIEYWLSTESLSLKDYGILLLVQLANGFSDSQLVYFCTSSMAPTSRTAILSRFAGILSETVHIREDLKAKIYLADIRERLGTVGFGLEIHTAVIQRLIAGPKSKIGNTVKDVLSSTMGGLYFSLREFYYRVGEGRVDTIKSIIEAERQNRPVPGVIVFDRGKSIPIRNGQAAYPGFAGAAGLFTELLGDDRFNVMTVLSDDIYISLGSGESLPGLISAFITREIMQQNLGGSIFAIIIQGSGLADKDKSRLRTVFNDLLDQYTRELGEVGGKRLHQFHRKVLSRFKRKVKKLGLAAETAEPIMARSSITNPHVRRLVAGFFNYALICNRFRKAKLINVRQASGQQQSFYTVRMATGERKLLMYDLAARIMDTESLPINVIIVSLWARTGWNVISPNVLIDATATRNVTAWQQLRGRAMRAWPSWCRQCSMLTMQLLGSDIDEIVKIKKKYLGGILSSEEIQQETEAGYNPGHQFLMEVINTLPDKIVHTIWGKNQFSALKTTLQFQGLDAITREDKLRLAVSLMLARNKVTHIYEMVKAYGTPSQIKRQIRTGEWQRLKSIASKHNHEYAVNPITGILEAGESHTPLIYAGNPRNNSPTLMKDLISTSLADMDGKVVRGWVDAAIEKNPGPEGS